MPMGRILPVHAGCIRRLATTTLLFAVLRWAEGVFFVGSPFNKLAIGPDLQVGALLLPLSSCRHGEGRRDVEGVGGCRVSSPSGAKAAAFSDEQVLRFMACGWRLRLCSSPSIASNGGDGSAVRRAWVMSRPTCHNDTASPFAARCFFGSQRS